MKGRILASGLLGLTLLLGACGDEEDTTENGTNGVHDEDTGTEHDD